MKKNNLLLLLAIASLLLIPETVLASNSIDELSTPFERVVGTITGPVGRWVSIAAMGLSGFAYVMKKEELEGGFKILLRVVFGVSLICFAASIIDGMFSFTGAVL